MTAAATLLAGLLSFVGLMAPHIALWPVSRARSVTFPYELPSGLFAALAGASWLIWLIGRRQRVCKAY